MLRSPNRIGQRTSNPQVARSNRARSATYPGVAQSGYEQESYKLLVVGSNPTTRTIFVPWCNGNTSGFGPDIRGSNP